MPLYVLVLLIVLGLACQAVSDPIEESLGISSTAESVPIDPLTEAATAEPVVEEPTVDVPTPADPLDGGISSIPTLAEAIETFEDIPQAHEENPVYFDTDRPPPGGIHAPVWQNCGVYTEPIETKHALHSLEHGAVWLTYSPDLSGEDVSYLQSLAKDQAYTLMSPFPGLRSSVILVAWGIRFDTDTVTDPRILEFLLTYQQGPQTPELGAPCQGGLGAPLAPDSLGISSS
jgi:hypothetical protein